MRTLTLRLLILAGLVLVAAPARAQLSGHNLKGDFGLQSASDETLERIGRGHTAAEFRDAALREPSAA